MNCPKCGALMADGATICAACAAVTPGVAAAATAPGATATPVPSPAAVAARGAAKDALATAKKLLGNPVGALAPEFEGLGPQRALGVGVAFGVAVALCMLLSIVMNEWTRPENFVGYLKAFVFAVVPFASTVVACVLARNVFKGQGSLSHDAFVAGSAVLPWGIVALAAGILGMGNYEVVMVLAVLCGCVTVLVLFAGMTRIHKMTEGAATLGVPVVLLLASWLSKVLYSALLQGGMGGNAFPHSGGF